MRLALSSALRSIIALGLENSDLFFAKSGDRTMMRRFRADGRCYGLLLATGCNGFDLVVRASNWFSGHFLTAFAFIQSIHRHIKNSPYYLSHLGATVLTVHLIYKHRWRTGTIIHLLHSTRWVNCTGHLDTLGNNRASQYSRYPYRRGSTMISISFPTNSKQNWVPLDKISRAK